MNLLLISELIIVLTTSWLISGGQMNSTSMIGREIDNTACKVKYGCHKGNCWISCDHRPFGLPWWNPWCYASGTGGGLDYSLVKCENDQGCDPCFQCSGPCNIWRNGRLEEYPPDQ